MPGPRQDLRRVLHGTAFEQAGYFTAQQALQVGYSYQAQKYHVDHGNWVRVDRGVFRLPEWPPDPDDAYVRWTLWSGRRGVVSHESALAVHEPSDVNPSRVHLSVPAGFRSVDDAVTLHIATWDDADVERRHGWSVTTPTRTLVDAAGGDVSPEHVEAAVAEAVQRGLVTRRRLLRLADGAPDRAALRLERALAANRVGDQ